MTQDLLHSLRILRRNPTFATTAVLTLALGIGANTAMFTVIRAVLLKPLAYHDPDRLLRLEIGTPVRYEMVKQTARSFSELGAFGIFPDRFTLTGSGDPEALRGARVSANFLR